MSLKVAPKLRPILDPSFIPAALWNREYRRLADATEQASDLVLALRRPNGSVSTCRTRILPHSGDAVALNQRYVERMVKALLYQRGGSQITVAGCDGLASHLAKVYAPDGPRSFDNETVGRRIYGSDLTFRAVQLKDAPEPNESASAVGRRLDGCRIGFDLGGSDRKCAALIDGKVVHSEEVVWDPYFQSDPEYHFQGIQDTLRRAASHLPRVDAIGGSAAGVYVDNQVRVASLFRGVPPDAFDRRVRTMFIEIQKAWGGVPFVMVNDGEVTALAASMSLDRNGILGISLGTSQAAGFVTRQGAITDWLNELAFVPVDYRDDAPADEWSGDFGVGVQYFSQQAVARLAPLAGFEFPSETPFAERLSAIQDHVSEGDEKALDVFRTIGAYFGYAVAHYAEFFDANDVLILGRVTSGAGGDAILEVAKQALDAEFPEIGRKLKLHLPDEKSKRLGQAVAAASLPAIQPKP